MLNRLFLILMISLVPLLCSINYKYEDINLNGKWDPFENLLKSSPSDKYITIGGAITEVVFSLGFGNSVIAVDQSSTMPERVQDLPDVGYIRMISSEKILSKFPNKIFTSTSMSPKIAVEQLKASPLEFMMYDAPKNIDHTMILIDKISEDLGVVNLGSILKNSMLKQINLIQGIKDTFDTNPQIVFFMNPKSGSYVAAGDGTVADYLIEFIGGENIFSQEFNSYQKVSEESILIKNPDIILVAAHNSENDVSSFFHNNENFQNLKSVKKDNIIEIKMSDLTMGTSFPENALKILKRFNFNAE